MKYINCFVNFVFIILLLVSCGLKKWDAGDGSNSFFVLGMDPIDGSALLSIESLELTFSTTVSKESINGQNLFLIKKTDYETYSEEEWDDIQDDVIDGSIESLDMEFLVSENGQVIQAKVVSEYELGEEYSFVVLPLVQAANHLPLNQESNGASTKQFVSSFLIVDPTLDGGGLNPSDNDDPPGSYPDLPEIDETDDSEDEIDGPQFGWNQILITEIVTDPQQDHGESAPGNDIPFDLIPGTGTTGSSDEYVEIFNGTAENLDISLWSLNMFDGTDETQTLGDGSLETFFSLDGSLENLSPGEFVVLGNPAGAMNNSILVELVDESGEIVDSVDVEDANASGLEDEAYYRDPDGEWVQGFASPGGFLDM